MNTVFSLFAVYDISGHIVLSAPLLFVIYTAGVLLLFPLIYRIYRRTQVA